MYPPKLNEQHVSSGNDIASIRLVKVDEDDEIKSHSTVTKALPSNREVHDKDVSSLLPTLF